MKCQIFLICTFNRIFNTIKIFIIFFSYLFFLLLKINTNHNDTNTLYSIFSNVVFLTREPRELENSDFDETLYTCRGGGVNR